MKKIWNFRSLLIVFGLTAAGMLSAGAVSGYGAEPRSEPRSGSPQLSSGQEPEPETPKADRTPDPQGESAADEDSAPAALELDVSGVSPLIRELYQATRETKEQAILASLARAKKLLDDGADVKATDERGRTALHWAIFGSSYNTKSTILVAYEEIADTLIQHGVEINKEDVYQDTALDYLLYSPSFEMQTLLIENGASSGFLAAFYHFFNDRAQGVAAHVCFGSPVVAQSRSCSRGRH